MKFTKILKIIIAIAVIASTASADSTEVKADSLLLYAPITGIDIDSNKAMDQWARYISRSVLCSKTKEYNIRQICIVNSTLDSLRGQKDKADCGCDSDTSFLSLKESFTAINQWKKLLNRNGRIVYRNKL
jgi:hypothetical protein